MCRQNLPLVEKINLKDTPFSVYSRFENSPYSFFLDSALASEKLGRFSFVGIEPFLVYKSKRDNITLDWVEKKDTLKGNPFFVLKDLFAKFRVCSPTDFLLPFIGGAVGYFSYDLKDFNERLPDRATDDMNIPEIILCFYDTILAFDRFRNEAFIVSTGFPEKGKKRLYRQKARLESLRNKIRRGQVPVGTGVSVRRIHTETPVPTRVFGDLSPDELEVGLESNFTKESYIRAVEKAKEYIKAGDIYQVNLSQRFRVNLDVEPFRLYRILRTINPAPFSCFLNFGDIKVASASPERFLMKKGRYIETRPIKGTRPRGKTPEEDRRLKEELVRSVKDRAENLMIVDLERNDLGRISEYGSVRVKEFMACEEYASVFHLVSTVTGKLREKIDPMDCLINCFPGGSITGAPKIRSMEIIEELEPVKRAVYTGSIGYIGFNGDMDTSVVIRTFVIKGKDVYFQVGGGIVYDSDPRKEYQETLDKARALMDAVGLCAGKDEKNSVLKR